MEQEKWVKLCYDIFHPVFERHGFEWKSLPPEGHLLRIIYDKKGNTGLSRWACATRENLSIIIKLDVPDAVVSINFFWGPDLNDGISLSEVVPFPVENQNLCFDKENVLSKSENELQYFVKALVSEKEIMLRKCGELLDGNYERYKL